MKSTKLQKIVKHIGAGLLVVFLNSWFASQVFGQGLIPFNVPGQPVVLTNLISSGTNSVLPGYGVAGEYGTWSVTHRAGEVIHAGGGLRIQLPEEWHADRRNSAHRLQASSPAEPNYVSAGSSNPDVILQTTVEFESSATLVKGVKPSNLTHRMGYYVFVVRVIVLKGEIKAGETISVIYGDQSKGSKGMRAGVITCKAEPVIIAIDPDGRGQFRIHSQSPKLEIRPGLPVEMQVIADSEGVVNEPIKLKISLLDACGNAANNYRANLVFESLSGRANLPSKLAIPDNQGFAEISVTPNERGVLRIKATETARKIQARSNPIHVHETVPSFRVFWGDLHSHTAYSASDAVGNPETAYQYARNISGLDFYAMTDHSGPVEPIVNRLTQREWPAYLKLADDYHETGRFVTLYAYEASFYAPFGHHNVYFRDKPGPLMDPDTVTLPELWKALQARQALTIPHHTLKMPEVVNWNHAHDTDFRRNFEIYSGHGSSEEYDPTHPLAYEQSLFTNPSTTTKTGMSAQRAWMEGFELSAIASSDDHRAQPGQPHYGLVAVRSKSLTRQDIFDALYERRTYATTGARIIFDFAVGNAQMGGKTKLSSPILIELKATGTDIIDQVEILRYVKGDHGFKVVYSESHGSDIVRVDYLDEPPPGRAIYYARLQQRKLIKDRVAMAWSSPIWVDVEEVQRFVPQ